MVFIEHLNMQCGIVCVHLVSRPLIRSQSPSKRAMSNGDALETCSHLYAAARLTPLEISKGGSRWISRPHFEHVISNTLAVFVLLHQPVRCLRTSRFLCELNPGSSTFRFTKVLLIGPDENLSTMSIDRCNINVNHFASHLIKCRSGYMSGCNLTYILLPCYVGVYYRCIFSEKSTRSLLTTISDSHKRIQSLD